MIVYGYAFLLSYFILANANLSIYVESPLNGASFVTNANGKLTVPLEYEIFGGLSNEQEDLMFCFTLKSIERGINIVEDACVPLSQNKLTINDLPSDQYALVSYLKNRKTAESMENTKVYNHFSISSYADALPKIELSADSAVIASSHTIAAETKKSATDLTLQYQLIRKFSNIPYAAVCILLMDKIKKQLLVNWSCLNPSDRQFSLSNLPIGNYEVHAIIKDSQITDPKNSMLESTEIIRDISVKSLSDVLPAIVVPPGTLEYVVHDTQSNKASIQLQYELHGIPSALRQVTLCLEIGLATSESILMPYTCLSSEQLNQNTLTLQNIPLGQYEVKFIVALKENTKINYSSTLRTVLVEIRRPVEFQPSYDWQPLHAWHTIPSGIETRLPIGEGSRKEARIPQPWRLQLPMPAPCKYFLRMDVHKHTKLSEIREKAGEHCQIPSKCFRLYLNQEHVEDYDISAEHCSLFGDEKLLLFDSSDEEECKIME